MAKDKFKRSNVKTSILKRVIIRMDFIGLTDITGCVNRLKPIMDGNFKKFNPINNKNYNVELNALQNNNHPVNVNIETNTLYQFSDCTIGPSQVNFMLGPDFAYLEIACSEDYEGCNEYIDLMANAIREIINLDSFISVKRLGLRKVDIVQFDDLNKMNSSIEEAIWDNYILNRACFPVKKTYSDLLYQKDVKTIFNLKRIVQEIEFENTKKYQYTFDIDSYKNGDLLNSDVFSSTKNIRDMILKQMNEPIFYYFIETFTEQFIDNFYNG